MNKHKKKYLNQNFDLNLYHLLITLEDLQKYNFPEEIKFKTKELLSIIDAELFSKIPNDYEIVDTKCIYIAYLEKPSLSNN